MSNQNQCSSTTHSVLILTDGYHVFDLYHLCFQLRHLRMQLNWRHPKIPATNHEHSCIVRCDFVTSHSPGLFGEEVRVRLVCRCCRSLSFCTHSAILS